MKIAVIYGGRSGEHEVSLVSAASIARALAKSHALVLIGITKDGRWFLQPEGELGRIKRDEKAALTIEEAEEAQVFVVPGGKGRAFKTAARQIDIDLVFPVLHGSYGEDGTIQGLFEMADVPYVGCSTSASALTMDKEKTKQALSAAGIPVVPYVCIRRSDLLDSGRYDALFKTAEERLGYPLFVKPCSAGSSNGASKARSAKEFSYALMEAFLWDDKVLVEKAVDAREIECSVTGNSLTASAESKTEGVKAYVPGEIIPTHAFYDYDAKYNDPDGASLHIPADLSAEMTETVRSLAVKAYSALDCSGLSRVDFLIDKTTGEIFLNEVNSMPGFTPISMFPKMCAQAGLDFSALTELLIGQAIAKYQAKSKIQTSRD
ncbi:MAG: D-alanine--D-alanine ligase family protein [Treponema sp.]